MPNLIYSNHDNTSGGDGIFISKARILGVTDTSGEASGNNSTPRDLSLQCQLQVDGVDFNPTFYISGDFKRDEKTNQVLTFGSAFRVLRFISTVTGLDKVELVEENNYRIDPMILQELVGKEFYRLSYRSGNKGNGKYRYSVWSTVGAADSDPEKLRERFLAEHAKTGYPTAYMAEPAKETPF